jgi:hypothetical protein
MDLNSKKLATAALAGGIGGFFCLTGEAAAHSAAKQTIDNMPGEFFTFLVLVFCVSIFL